MKKNIILDNIYLFDKNFISVLEQMRILNILKSKGLLTDDNLKKARVQIINLYIGKS